MTPCPTCLALRGVNADCPKNCVLGTAANDDLDHADALEQDRRDREEESYLNRLDALRQGDDMPYSWED